MFENAFPTGRLSRLQTSPCGKVAFLCCAFLVLLLSSKARADWYYEEAHIFGTNVSIQLWADNDKSAEAALAESISEMWRIHNQLSPYIEESELSQLNKLGYPGPFKVSDEFAQLIDKSIYYGELSGGAFDITFASLGYLYNYRDGKKPTEEEIEQLKSAINFRLIDLDRDTNEVRYLNSKVKIDLGGIAKGYAVERVVSLLRNRGIDHAAVTAGGDSRVLGDKRGQPWIVGIRSPRADTTDKDTDNDIAIRIPLEDFAISTSGDYERYFIDAETGERVHHILNPASGTSASTVASVSVIGPSGSDTDPLSTTLFVLGREKGLLLIEKIPEFDAVFIDLQGKTYFSSGLQPPE